MHRGRSNPTPVYFDVEHRCISHRACGVLPFVFLATRLRILSSLAAVGIGTVAGTLKGPETPQQNSDAAQTAHLQGFAWVLGLGQDFIRGRAAEAFGLGFSFGYLLVNVPIFQVVAGFCLIAFRGIEPGTLDCAKANICTW